MKKTPHLAFALLALFATLALSGCGFHPIYGNRGGDSGSPVAMDLNNITIANVPNRDGQFLRNALIDRLYGKNRPTKPQYTLRISLGTSEEDLGILANATATRSLLTMNAHFSLLDTKEKELLSGEARSIASFEKLDQMYANVAARQEAHERTLNEISEQITNRLGLYFSERH